MNTVRQAGAIAIRGAQPHAEVLIVRAKKNPSQWIFPKGHIEPGETAEAAALRELHEEAGVEGDLAGPAGVSSFKYGDRDVIANYYVVRFTRTSGPGDGRESRWVSLSEARRLLSFPDAVEHLSNAERTL